MAMAACTEAGAGIITAGLAVADTITAGVAAADIVTIDEVNSGR